MDKNIILKEKKDRIEYVDGIRGISSILVIFCHLACVFIPGLYFAEQINNGFEHIWINSPLNILTNGNMPVQSFFVLSGYLITRKMYQSKRKILSPLREYRKLLRVVIPGIAFSAILMAFGLMFHLKAAEVNSTLSFVKDYNNFSPTFFSVIKDIFFSSFINKSIYDGPFWTIKHEFLGALLITGLSYYAASNKKSKLYYFILGIVLLFVNPYLVSFVIGAFIFDCIFKENDDHTVFGRIISFVLKKRICIFFVLIVGIYLLCTNNYLSGIWKPIKILKFLNVTPEVSVALGWGLCLLCIDKINLIKKLFAIRPLIFLGKISAYTYAFHWPIILSLGCGMYLILDDMLPYYYCVLLISITVIIVTIIFSFLFVKLLPKVLRLEEKIKDALIKRIPNRKKQ